MAALIVDGMNVIGTRPDGWWRDRDAAVRHLLARLQTLATRTNERIMLVLDGRPLDDVPEGEYSGVSVVYARRAGRNAGDDRIVELVRDLDDATSAQVVTSDRDLVARATKLGASVIGAGALLARLDEGR